MLRRQRNLLLRLQKKASKTPQRRIAEGYPPYSEADYLDGVVELCETLIDEVEDGKKNYD